MASLELTILDAWDFSDYVTITRTDGTSFRIHLNTNNEFSQRFFDALYTEWAKANHP